MIGIFEASFSPMRCAHCRSSHLIHFNYLATITLYHCHQAPEASSRSNRMSGISQYPRYPRSLFDWDLVVDEALRHNSRTDIRTNTCFLWPNILLPILSCSCRTRDHSILLSPQIYPTWKNSPLYPFSSNIISWFYAFSWRRRFHSRSQCFCLISYYLLS